ncbi:MAG: hypothetical protein U7123_03575 [Potamolinea sp.]
MTNWRSFSSIPSIMRAIAPLVNIPPILSGNLSLVVKLTLDTAAVAMLSAQEEVSEFYKTTTR